MSEHSLNLFDPLEDSLLPRGRARGVASSRQSPDGALVPLTIAVIGAGISGLAAARTLADCGFEVTVFDKGRGPGGRMSTRRTNTSFRFDHGTQYFTAKDERFRRYVEAWHELGVVKKWDGRIVELDGGEISPHESSDRYVGVPGMNAVCKHLAHELNVVTKTRIDQLADGARWELVADATSLGRFDAVVVAIPPAQAADLLSFSPSLCDQITATSMAPCWAAMFAFRDNIEFPADGAFVRNSAISWIARDSSKPSRQTESDCWVVHGSAEWSSERIERESDEIRDQLLAEFLSLVGAESVEPLHAVAHRWRFANPTRYLKSGFLADNETRLLVCGDWCLGNRVEAAFLSGVSAARALVQYQLLTNAPIDRQLQQDSSDGSS